MGGQGRTSDEIQETAAATGALVFAGLMMGCALGFSLAGLHLFAIAFAVVTIVSTGVAYLLMACPCVESDEGDTVTIVLRAKRCDDPNCTLGCRDGTWPPK